VSSGNLIHHAYHLARFEEATGQRIDGLGCVVEFGGGYGNMCRTVRRAGFTGPYIILDLPYFSALQRYYLRASGLPVATSAADLGAGRTLCTSDATELAAAVARAAGKGGALLIGTWSISEAPVAARALVLDQTDAFDFFLIGYQPAFAGIDNERFFAAWTARHGGVDWQFQPIRQLEGSRYLFGRRRT
jgi:hypothetical protein